jgi:hypothetical protein
MGASPSLRLPWQGFATNIPGILDKPDLKAAVTCLFGAMKESHLAKGVKPPAAGECLCPQVSTVPCHPIECGCDGSVLHMPPSCPLCQALAYLKSKTICPKELKRVVCVHFTACFSTAEGFKHMAHRSVPPREWDEASCVAFIEHNLPLLYMEANRLRQAELAKLMAR